MHLNMSCPYTSHASEGTKCISTCIEQTPPLPVRTQNAPQHVLNKPILCQRGIKMHLNMCCPNPSLANEDTKCISKCLDHNAFVPARTENISQRVLTNLSHARDNIKFISTWVDLTPPMRGTMQNVSLHVLTKPHPCQRGYKKHLKMC